MALLTLETLRSAIESGALALRCVTHLSKEEIEGAREGSHDHATQSRYATKGTTINGRELTTPLIDSVAAQSTRLEAALLAGWDQDELPFPKTSASFRLEGLTGPDPRRSSALASPRRVAGALLADGMLEGLPFHANEVVRAIAQSRPDHATGTYRYCPTALVFGVNDGPPVQRARGAHFQRAMVSEVVGLPDLRHAVQTSVLSLPALRKLRFPENTHGEPLPGDARARAELAAHIALTTLALVAVVYQREQGCPITPNSRWVPSGPLEIQLIHPNSESLGNGQIVHYGLLKDQAQCLLRDAVDHARAHGMGWERGPYLLTAAPRLKDLIRAGRSLPGPGITGAAPTSPHRATAIRSVPGVAIPQASRKMLGGGDILTEDFGDEAHSLPGLRRSGAERAASSTAQRAERL